MTTPQFKESSVIPFDREWSVILRDTSSNALVLRNRHSNEVNLRHDLVGTLKPAHNGQAKCPYCKRILPEEWQNSPSDACSPEEPFMNQEYFHLLAQSTTPSRSNSRPSTPDRKKPTHHGIKESSFTDGYFQKFFISEGVLGRGGRGQVIKVRHELDGFFLGHYACKKIPVGNDHECEIALLFY